MVRSPITLKALVLCGSLIGASAASANLLTNGSFESGGFVNQGNDTMSLAAGSTVITGWTVVNDITAWIGATNPFGLTASDGSFFLDLTNYQLGAPFAGVSQTIATVAGQTYALSFDLGGSTTWGLPDAITASAAGTSATFATPATGTTTNSWYHETMQFTATSALTTILLQGVSGANYIGLDNASVDLATTPPPPPPGVPEPSTYTLMIAGLGAAAIAGRRRKGKTVGSGAG